MELLADAVRSLAEEGRRPYASSLKPELQRRSRGLFDEHAMGFRSFVDFLRAAERDGVVKLASPTGHVEAWPPDFEPPVDQTNESSARTKADTVPGTSIRPDLWKAFMDWDSTVQRVYDTREDRALMVDPTAGPSVSPQLQEWSSDPARFIRIEPIDRATQLSWMQDFVLKLDDELAQRELLVALADKERPAAAFTAVLRRAPSILMEWNRARLVQLAKTIEEWSNANGLELGYWRKRTAVARRQRHVAWSDDQVANLREILHGAIASMPLSDLLRLPIPIEYVVRG